MIEQPLPLGKCTMCGEKRRLYKIPDPNENIVGEFNNIALEANREAEVYDSVWYVCERCRKFIIESQEAAFEEYLKREKEEVEGDEN